MLDLNNAQQNVMIYELITTDHLILLAFNCKIIFFELLIIIKNLLTIGNFIFFLLSLNNSVYFFFVFLNYSLEIYCIQTLKKQEIDIRMIHKKIYLPQDSTLVKSQRHT